MRAYYWMCGYDLSYGDNATVLIRRGRSHPAFDPRSPCEYVFDYQGLPLLQHEMVLWYHAVETHPVVSAELLVTTR